MSAKALVLIAHPHLSQSVANKSIVENLKNNSAITLHNLYDHYPYFHIDIKKEQELLRQHQMVVMQHPFFWYNMPPLLKMWMDDVLAQGFAYGPNGDALKNKKFMLSITTGGNQIAYSDLGVNSFNIDQYLFSYKQTCKLCQMQWIEPAVLFASRKTESSDISEHADNIKNSILKNLRT